MLNFNVGGKSGTSRRTVGKHGYGAGKYTASFVELFPLQAPQYVMLVKLNNPKGDIFGGSTAAPVSKIVLQAALAASNASLDRSKLAMRDPADSLRPGRKHKRKKATSRRRLHTPRDDPPDTSQDSRI